MGWVLAITLTLTVLLVWRFRTAVQFVGWLMSLGKPGWTVLVVATISGLISLRLLYLEYGDYIVTALDAVRTIIISSVVLAVLVLAGWVLRHIRYQPYATQAEGSLTQQMLPLWRRFTWVTRHDRGRDGE